MRKFIVVLLCALLAVVFISTNTFALHYTYEDWDYEFDDTNYWINGWCYSPLDEVEKTAILVAYDPAIIRGEDLIIPEIINGYRVSGFAHGLFRWSTFKSCDLSAFPNLSKRMFERSSLENVILSKDTKKIPDGCFLDCPIEEIELYEGIEIIEAYAFRGTKLKELIIPSTVKELEFQVASYCPELKKIEFKNGTLAGFDEDSLSLGATFMVENLETLILPENITHIGENEFKVAEAGRHGFNFIKYPDNLTIYGKKGSYAEAYAAERKLKFVAIKEEIVSAWAKAEIAKADELGLIPKILDGVDLTDKITRAEFAAVAVKVYENLSGSAAIPAVINPFTDTKDVEILKAYNIGVVNGTSATTYSPDDLLNREQAAAMLTRVFKKTSILNWTLATDSQFALPYEKPALFADDEDISDWAKESVYFMVANGIINGVGNNKFAPKNVTTEEQAQGYANATREQALLIAVRMVENLK